MTIMPWTGPGPNPEQPWAQPIGGLRPKRRGGLFGASAQLPQMAQTQSEQPLAPKQKFFGEGGVGRAIAGNIGDFLLQYSGMQPIYAPIMQQRQAAQQAEMQRQQGLADWVAKQEYEAAHPKPVNNDTINDFNWYKSLSEEDKAIYRQMKPEYRQGPDGRFYRIDIAPDAGRPAIGAVVPDPRKQGGPSATPTGTFPR